MSRPTQRRYRRRHSLWQTLGRRAAVTAFVVLGALILVGVVGWFLGWGSVTEYGEGLLWAGILVIGFGMLGIRGEWEATRSFPYQYSMSVTDQPGWERAKQVVEEGMQSHWFLVETLTAGGICILIGMLIRSWSL